SIFIAAPLLTTWKEREPEWARRMHAGEEGDAAVPARQRAALRRPGGDGAPATATTADATELALEESEAAPAAEPAPALLDFSRPSASQAKRDRRRQRRRTRPHGRAN